MQFPLSDSGYLCYVLCGVLVGSGRVVCRFLREERSVGAAAPCGPGPPCGAVWVLITRTRESNNVVQPPGNPTPGQ